MGIRIGSVICDGPAISDSVSVGTNSTQVFVANKDCCHRECRNLDSTKEISLGFGTDAVVNKGVVLKPGESWYPTNNIFCGVINGIVSSETAELTVLEY